MDAATLARLLDTTGPALVLYARPFCADAEAVVQEAFVRLASLGVVPDDPAAWLFRAVRNGAISAGRSEKRRRRREGEVAKADVFVPADSPIDAEAVAAALAGLAAETREAVVAHLWGGLSFARVGELLGVSAATAHRRYLEGLSLLRERLRPCTTISKTP